VKTLKRKCMGEGKLPIFKKNGCLATENKSILTKTYKIFFLPDLDLT